MSQPGPIVVNGGTRLDDDALDSITNIHSLEQHKATQLANNPDAVTHIADWTIVNAAPVEYPLGGDPDEVLSEQLDIVPNAVVNVYERDHPSIEYFVTFAVDSTVYQGLTFSGDLESMVLALLQQFDIALGDVTGLHSIHARPRYDALKSRLEAIDAELRTMSLTEAIDETG